MCLLSAYRQEFRPVVTAVAPTYVIEREQGDWLAERLEWTGSVRPRQLAPDAYWNQWWHQCKWISPNIWWDVRKFGAATWLTYGDPITRLAHLRHLEGKPVVGYPPGTVTYDQLAGVGNPTTIRLDWLGQMHGSVALLPHEVWHTVRTRLLGGEFLTEWLEIHVEFAGKWGDEYTEEQPAEAEAEAYAYIASGLGQPARIETYFDKIHKQRNWGPWPQGV